VEAPKEDDGEQAAHMEQEAPEEGDGEKDDGEEEEGSGQGRGQQQVNYWLVEFYFYLYSFLYEVTNSIFLGCDALSWLHLLGARKTGQ
jgi:hypothetical protein